MLPASARLLAPGGTRATVGVAPLRQCARLLWILVPWVLVVVVGRGICLVAKRLPPLVWLVRAVAGVLEARRSARAAHALGGGVHERPESPQVDPPRIGGLEMQPAEVPSPPQTLRSRSPMCATTDGVTDQAAG
ncbi:MAG: hypothetical protein H7233_12160 [Pseudorhodobacter sp.]|nr:hypothetical protein [Frankiaceae bacterium]